MPRRLGGAPAATSSPAAGRSSSPTTTTPTSTTPPRSCSRCARRSPATRDHDADAAVDRARRVGARHAVPRRRLGRVRRRQHPRSCAATLPFCDFGEVIDPPSADVTAHVVEMLAAERRRRRGRAARRGVEWLLATHQEADGSWFGRWGANHVYGTGAVVPALVAAGVAADDRAAASRAVRVAATAHQNADGGWGEDLRSYRDPALDRPRRVDAVADGVGAARRCSRAGDHGAGRRPRRRWLVAHPAARRHLGRAVVHRHRLPRRLLHQLPPVPAGVPGDGARALPRREIAWMSCVDRHAAAARGTRRAASRAAAPATS